MRDTAGIVVVFSVDFFVVVSLSLGSSSVERAHNMLNRGILRRREAEERVCVLYEASTTCRYGIRRCGVTNSIKGCDGEAPNFLVYLGSWF